MEGKRFLHSLTEKESIKEKIKLYLARSPYVLFSYLFGSFTENTSYADIDVAVFFVSEESAKDYLDLTLQFSMDLSSIIGIPVEVHCLNKAGLEFQYQATKGELLTCRDDEERFNFLEKLWSQYFDFQYFIQENLRDLLAQF